MASRYYHASKHPDETPLEYLYRLNVAAMRAKIPYADGTAEENREHVELFINTLGSSEQELASPLTLMEVPDVPALETKLRARQRGLVHQKKTLFGSSKFRQKAPASLAPPPRAVHAIHATTDGYDTGQESCDSEDLMYDQDRDEDDRAKMFMAGQTPQGEPVRREAGSDDAGRKSREAVSGNAAAPNDNTYESKLVRTMCDGAPQFTTLRYANEYAREPLLEAIELQPGERRGYWKHYAPHKWYKQAKIHGKLNNRRGVLLLDTGAEVSILDTTFAREIGCLTDTNVTQESALRHLVGQHAILGMNFMVPAGVRIYTAKWTACLPDEVRIQLIGRRPLYGAKMHPIGVASPLRVDPGQARDVPLRPDRAAPLLWVTHGKSWVVTLVKGKIGRKSYLHVTNIGERRVMLDAQTPIGWWTPTDAVPRAFGFVQPDSRRYQEWQNLAYGATCDENDAWTTKEPDNKEPELRPRIEERVEDRSKTHVLGAESGTRTEDEDDVVVIHEGTDLFAEELESEKAVLPDLSLTAEVKIGDLKVGQPTGNEPQVVAREGECLRQIIWKRRRWLIGKCNAVPPAAVGVVCNIDVGDARPVAQRVRKIPPQFRENVADLIKGLLSAGMIQHSTSPWASPIVVIVKKNGVDIRLCISYRLVNDLTQLMVYPMPVVNDLLEYLDKYLWYCSLDMASGFWVVPMTDRARLISAFITPLGLFEWLRIPFGLCNAPQIYQRLIDNALYGFLRPSPDDATRDVFEEGTPVRPGVHSILGRRSYIDDILIGGTSWYDLCEKVERLLDACERWHISISVEKSEWGMTKWIIWATEAQGAASEPTRRT
ncbi:unnamed protein product [Phytophthora fragariaefolia]|uniref:Unnamed protein product n=1 Tax=Phytophthora fragariaefolia TaxID=1490495 RepID=A0A9W6WJ20_9STRA|nr:unnamed protein product [Phytophthora fragariaefolia]